MFYFTTNNSIYYKNPHNNTSTVMLQATVNKSITEKINRRHNTGPCNKRPSQSTTSVTLIVLLPKDTRTRYRMVGLGLRTLSDAPGLLIEGNTAPLHTRYLSGHKISPTALTAVLTVKTLATSFTNAFVIGTKTIHRNEARGVTFS